MVNNIEKELLEELKRFNQIKHNSSNLNEQQVNTLGGIGGVANLGMGSHVERLLDRAKAMEMSEQEEAEVDPMGGGSAVDPMGGGSAIEDEGGAEEMEVDVEDDMGDEEVSADIDDAEMDAEVDAEVEDTTELDVTDLVSKQDEVSAELSDQQDILSKNTESLEDLMSKLSQLETHLTSMDSMMSKIDKLEDKLEEYRPRTPEEQQQIRRKYDSGPFSNSLSDFFNDKEEGFEESGKKQYILTKDEVENYSDEDIKKSFGDPEEDDDDIRNDYRGVK